METKLIIQKQDADAYVYVYQDGERKEEYIEAFEDKRLEGNIYLGKVKDVVKGMQSAFIDIGTGKNAFIHIRDLIPKISDITGNEEVDINQFEIYDLVKPGDNIIVQIKKDCNNNKGPRVTKDIKLVGKYAVLMPYVRFITISKKIEDKNEKNRLINIAKEYKNFGIILRTSAEGKDEDVIKKDIDELAKIWANIQKNAEGLKEPKELYSTNGIIGKLIDDFEPQGLSIQTNSEDIKEFINEIDYNLKVTLNKELSEVPTTNRKIYLKCGGFITIDITEALVAIDVNSGKFTGKKELEDTVLKVNKEAAQEIAKQIRLRDLGGIIIIDFIDMDKAEDREIIKAEMEELIKKDRTKVQILEFTKLGLLELTRKHILGK